MTFLARFVRFLFWLFILSWSIALLRRVAAWISRSSAQDVNEQSGETTPAQRLHRDPVCGTHVSEEIALPLREAGETLHFCSEECRNKYVSARRLAAHG